MLLYVVHSGTHRFMFSSVYAHNACTVIKVLLHQTHQMHPRLSSTHRRDCRGSDYWPRWLVRITNTHTHTQVFVYSSNHTCTTTCCASCVALHRAYLIFSTPPCSGTSMQRPAMSYVGRLRYIPTHAVPLPSTKMALVSLDLAHHVHLDINPRSWPHNSNHHLTCNLFSWTLPNTAL